ncbi:thiol:disulfide interchange protein DsbA/DsbL [Halioglobus maricola]|uniref:Thiol:disulfide interchange protein n=1 Tax=Halioglobus maricola TaxID=2601894 RepID=A0A5P9NF63_9GAMM|nr:thiol:disulfide interchange protein DsbA/DsbL [Halioglobus maricola]QFU74195.1 thiol:disulfide interchange protein DsbA/DsbL [Halioglobus maricola]
MFKRIALVFSLMMVSLLACAQDGETWEAGKHYTLIQPAIRTANPDKIEVAEFFWYGCGHCYTFEPVIGQWKKTIADDVAFRAIPAQWGGAMELHAKAFYTAEALGVAETMHPVIFQAMNVDRKRLGSEEEIAELFVANGVAEEDFLKAYSSFGVSSQARQANSTARGAKVSGTPSVMVNGKYMISARTAGSNANMLKVADYLVEKERAAAGS